MNIDLLFNLIINNSLLNWSAANEGCEARADYSAELVANETDFEVEKIWAEPPYNGCLEVYLDKAKTEGVVWNYHVAVVVNADTEDYVLDPVLFRNPVSVSEWQTRITIDSMEGVNFRRSSRLAYSLPYSYEGDCSAREKMLKIRKQELEQNSNLKVFDTIVSVAKYRRACFLDELRKTKRGKFEKLDYARRHHALFSRMWITSWLWDEFLASIEIAEHWCGIHISEIKQKFDVTDPLLQLHLQLEYWEHMDEVFCQVEELGNKLQNLSNTSELSQQYKDFMEMDEVYNVWYSPYGTKLWAKFGYDIINQR